jgi:SAM-dependent methyltransferase
MTVATAKAVVADRSPGDEDFGHFRCKACGVTDGHDPNCPVYDCPHCGVSPDDAVLHGHDPGCPNDARRRDEHPPVNPDVGDIDTAGLLDDTYKFLNRFLVVNAAALVAGALFTGHTYAFAAAETTPRLSIRSPEAESGKSRWLEALEHVVRRGWYLIEPSIAALYRVTEKERRSILFDEIDTMLGPAAHNAEDVRAFLNAGYRKGAKVPRCVGEGSKMTVKDFDVFAPVVVAGIGKLPPTTETRSIVVHMKPRTKGEPVERLRIRKVRPIGEALRARWAAWAEAHTEELTEAEPDLPDELSDRMQDVWEPLLAIADLAGEGWAARARAAAQELFESRDQDDESIGRRLLADIRAVLDDPERDDPDDDTHGQAIASGALASALAAIEGGPWAEWTKDNKPISATKVAWLLRRFGIRPGQHKICGRNVRGYLRSDFEDAWLRHLPDPDPESDPDPPPPGESDTDAKLLPPNPNKGKGGNTSRPVTPSPGGGDGSGREQRGAQRAREDNSDTGGDVAQELDAGREPELAQLTIGGKAEPIDAKGTPARGPKHPAEFSAEIIPFLAAAAPPGEYPRVLDPMAGKGGIHKLANLTIGVKLEPEWAFARPGTIKGNAFYLPFRDESFDAIVTSPTYGNRYADDFIPSEESKSKWTWRSYTLDLGRKLHPDNTGQLHWGPKYRADHLKAWTEAVRVLRPGGRFVLNISDHIRNHERQYVTDWHVEALTRLGLREIARKPVPTKRMRYGTNAEARVDAEHVITFEKPAATSVGDGLDDLRSLLRDDPKRFTR